jgi:mannosyltransferase OCH1-like enzyme
MKRRDFPDFDNSMNFSVYYNQHKSEYPEWNQLIQNYNNFRLSKKGKEKIPKVVHQIWVGGPMKDFEKQCTDQVKSALGDDWEYKLWNEKNIPTLKYIDRETVNKASSTTHGLAKVVDLVRYAILYEFGGVYMDTDFILHKDFNELLDLDFFVGTAYDAKPVIFNGLIGCAPKLELVKNLSNLDRSLEDKEVMDVTGPWFATRRMFEFLNKDVVAFPVSFFYPFPNFPRQRSIGNNYKDYIKQETICTHLWSSAWM